MTSVNDFSIRLKNLRERLGISQAAMAELMEVEDYHTISRWERGLSRPRRSAVSQLERLENEKNQD